MPFAGSPADAEAAVRALTTIRRRDGDELILVDNSVEPAAAGNGTVRVIRATEERSSYSARNAGAAEATCEWLLFLDADTKPEPGILDAYFDPPADETVGALAGTVTAAGDQPSWLARYATSRGYLSQAELLEDDFRPHAVTANLLVRRRAFESIGGFAQGASSGGDSDFCWRLQEAGWRLDARPAAEVGHAHRESLSAVLGMAARYARGRAWLRRRWPGAFAARPDAGVGDVVRALASAARWLALGEFERSAFRALDGAVGATDLLAEQLANRPRPASSSTSPESADLAVLLDAFPVQSETFVVEELRALQRAGHRLAIEASHRPIRQALEALTLAPVRYAEDDSRLEKLAALAWIAAKAPGLCLRDMVARRRWRREEPVLPLRAIAPVARRIHAQPHARLYCHFAGPAALTSLRVARLLGRPYALTAHAYDIFREPRNLREKLESADVVFTGCAYNVDHLRRIAPGARVHEIVMGVDPERLRRSTPLPGGRRVIGVGRLVEKKGFEDLLAAVARLSADDVTELVLVGDGPLRESLQTQAQTLGIADRVRFLGAVEPSEVQTLLEEADVLGMPCVVAGDGDRDSMPVVVKEAMALELVVVGTCEVGLPELIRKPWGSLVPPHDPAALADALAELLRLDPAARAEAGRAGRAHVLEHGHVDREAAKLAALLGLGSDQEGPLLLVEPLRVERGGHPARSLPLLAAAAHETGRSVAVVAPRGIDPEVRAALEPTGARILTGVRSGPAAGAAMLTLARALDASYERLEPRMTQRLLPYQLQLFSNALTEAGSLRLGRAALEREAAGGPLTAVVLTANLTLHGFAGAISGVPHVRYLHDLSRHESRLVRLADWLLRSGSRRVSVICTTKAVEAGLRRHYPTIRSTVQPYALDNPEDRITPDEREAARRTLGLSSARRPVASLVGGWWLIKDMSTVVGALEAATRPFTLLVAGYRMDPRTLAKMKANHRGEVHVIDRQLSATELGRVYAASDFTIVSRAPGGKESGVALDAAARGVPLIVSDHDPELTRRLEDQPWARVFRRGDPESLARTLDEAVLHPLPAPPADAARHLGMVRSAEMIQAFERAARRIDEVSNRRRVHDVGVRSELG